MLNFVFPPVEGRKFEYYQFLKVDALETNVVFVPQFDLH